MGGCKMMVMVVNGAVQNDVLNPEEQIEKGITRLTACCYVTGNLNS